MWLLGVILDNICGFFKVCFSRTLSKQIYRNCAVLMTGTVVVAVLVFTAGSFTGGGKNQVYAVKASRNAEEAGEGEDVKEEELQAGLMGIVASVNKLEAYSQAADGVDLETANQEILAGTSRIRKNALYQKYVEECAKNIGSIGYYAQQKVLENQMDGNDYYTLLQIVEAEATGGDIKSKILIANVVLNRVKDSRFPDTIYDVVWQTAGGSPQFSPTDDGRIYTVSLTDDTIEAVDRALAGEDYSQGALFFAARASAEAQNMVWFDQNLVQMFEYGGHEFFCFADE